MIAEVGKHSDLIKWDDNPDEEHFDLKVISRTFDPDTITVSIFGRQYTFFSSFETIELFLKLYRLGAKGQSLALLKENDKKLQLIVLEFKGLSDQDVKSILFKFNNIADSTHYSSRHNSGTLYYDKDVTQYDVDVALTIIDNLNFDVKDTSKKYKKLTIKKSS